MKISEASNADKDLIETITTELTKQKVIVDKKTYHGLDSYYKNSTAKQLIDFIIIGPSRSKRKNTSNDKLTPQKQLNMALSQSCSQIYENQLNINPLSANPTKWSNTLEQFVGNLPTNCLSVFNHFVKLALKGLTKQLLKHLPEIKEA